MLLKKEHSWSSIVDEKPTEAAQLTISAEQIKKKNSVYCVKRTK